MYIEKYDNKGTETLRLCESYRPPGSSRARRKIIMNIGPLAKVSDGKPDFLERLRQSLREGNPILPILEPYLTAPEDTKESTEEVELVYLPFPVKGESEDGAYSDKWFADMLLHAYMKELGLSHLFTLIKSRSELSYDLLGFVKIMVYGRILAPCSKWATVKQNDSYLMPVLKAEFNPYSIYDALDVVEESKSRIFRAINTSLSARREGRNTTVVFYGLTNFYFEIEQNDPDILDNDGVVIEEGFRKRGHSKENRPQPIVQMGLFMDSEGVPIGIDVFPGNRVDKTTLVDAVTDVITPLGYERFIYCADRGLCTLANLAFLVQQDLGYLLSKSIKQSKKEDKEWILRSEGYIEEKDQNGVVVFKHKSTQVKRTYTDENGNVTEFTEKVVVFWSLEVFKREQHMMESFSSLLTKLEQETESFTLSSSQVRKIKRFLKDEILESLDPANDATSPSTGESPSVQGVDKAEGSIEEIQMAKDTANDAAPSSAGESPAVQEDDKAEELGESEETHATKDQTEQLPSKEQTDDGKKKSKRKKLTQEEKDQRAADKKAEIARQKALKDAKKKRLEEKLKDSVSARTMIDWEKVNRWRDYAGYYQIVTSELSMDDKEIIGKYRELTQIENRFRTMKGTIDTRPIYVRNHERIKAHLIICAIALVILALIQHRVKKADNEEKLGNHKWYLGMSPDRVQKALNALLVEKMPQEYYRFRSMKDDMAGKDLQVILDAHDIKIPRKLYTLQELKKLCSGVTALESSLRG